MRDIQGYEGLYGITSCGRVWSYRSQKFLKPKINKGYLRVELDKTFDSMNEAKRQTNIDNGSISSCCRGNRNTAGGYHWEFV